MKNICFIVGARPNLMKLAPIVKRCEERKISYAIVHTGQHYTENMNDVFFKVLKLPSPDYNIGVGGGDPAKVVGKVMQELPDIFDKIKPEWVVVFGDVSSTIAATLTAKYHGYKIAHVEAGIRSFDWRMPEEINRVVTDRIADIRFTPEPAAKINLEKEGLSQNNFYVGNIMINTLIDVLPEITRIDTKILIPKLKNQYGVVTIHRNTNVDTKERLDLVIKLIRDVCKKIQIVMPLHPRTKQNLTKFNLMEELSNIKNLQLIDPLDYIGFMALVKNSKWVITDSGGVQSEATYLGIPTITVRENTEWTETITIGTNVLCRLEDGECIDKYVTQAMNNEFKKGRIPEMWDNKVAERILDVLTKM
ncbi:UDP-N-acetylglucosamine 2-epimerase [Candidatus Bilamarchaeum dharawalense]|uniref:UDP-N-acetylglucosamine 2-epimerase n=1 Tax=Candidatus Bilamarchaeum dharawalense TaxID=2885759 RepID=A0A5E4LPV5_9ARCH|nr:UDP-N-acetylglucosamine 2-epimerase [Candidatus Bilamarchaeum dharawalense]